MRWMGSRQRNLQKNGYSWFKQLAFSYFDTISGRGRTAIDKPSGPVKCGSEMRFACLRQEPRRLVGCTRSIYPNGAGLRNTSRTSGPAALAGLLAANRKRSVSWSKLSRFPDYCSAEARARWDGAARRSELWGRRQHRPIAAATVWGTCRSTRQMRSVR